MQIKIRSRKLKDGKTERLYLDCYDEGKRWYESLKLRLTGNRVEDKNAWNLAKDIAARRRLEFVAGEYGFAQRAKQNDDFIEFAKKLGKTRRAENTRSAASNPTF
jgi:hypothetical protein